MRSHPADTLVSLGGQRVARTAATVSKSERVRIPIAEVPLWQDAMEALMERTPRERRKRMSDRMEVGE